MLFEVIRLSKLKPTDSTILVFDVRSKSIALERGTEPKVFLGRIVPNHDETKFHWQSRWGANCGEVHSLEDAQFAIEKCASSMYK